jgi:F-type H+-transporting ATPase subunit delta
VADNSHQISGVAERYASSLYELAADAKSVDAVDASLLGGLIVKIGSRQVDTSLRTKLSTLKHTLKEVG